MTLLFITITIGQQSTSLLSFSKQVKCDTGPTKETARKLFIQSAIEYPH